VGVDLAVFMRFLARRAWLVVVLAALGAALGLAWGAAQPRVYEGVTRVKVFPMRSADLGQTQALQAMIRSYVLDVPTVEMAQAVAAQMGIPLAQALRLRTTIDASADPNLYEIQVKARSRDPAEAERLSDQWARAFIAQRTAASRKLDPSDRIVATLRDNASHTLYAPRRKLLLSVGLILGALVGLGLALAAEYFSQAVVRDAGAASDLAGVPLVADLPWPAGRPPAGRGQVVREAGRTARGLARAAWPVAVLALLGAAVALAVSLLMTPEYRARTRIAVEPSRGSDWGQTQSIQETMRGYSADIATRRMAEQVSAALQLDLPADMVLGWATVAPEAGAYEIYLDVRHPDPDVARQVSETWARTFIQERELANLDLDQRDRTLVRVRDETTVELWAPKKAVNLLAGLVLGALVGLGLVYVQWWRRGQAVRQAGPAHGAGGSPVGARPQAPGPRSSEALP
jgi:capsular polysaccharide biosynthesis protein